ncbi:hypothetical protein [Archangium lansingense]|uniref:Uncharacterized protein n=1 Tax=Archangium lansingense TaxID=2995310 RepID=A0ABT4AQA7_9BACT|nr:hypothetical protein [Archangium lansinium]MCY1082957.1 hypothetical protein [Archangium lansinium]
MADTGFFKGWLGPFKLIRRYTTRKPEPESGELGRVYEAHNVLTSNPALVLIPSESAPMEPQEEWRVRLRSQSAPPYVALEVEKAPASGRLSQLRGVLELLGTVVERLGNGEEARAHLTCLPMGPLESLKYRAGRAWRWTRASRKRTFAVCFLMYLSLRLVVHVVEMDVYGLNWDMTPRPVMQGVPVRPADARRAPALINKASVAQGPIAYPLPAKPFIDQAKAPCIPNEGEVEINGGCWVALEKRPPCFGSQAEYEGKCYLPVSARSRDKREPRSFHQ